MPRLIRTSERTTFTGCRQRWWWTYEEKLRPKIPTPALRFGTLVHAAMEKRYPPGLKRGPHPARTFERLYEKELETQMGFGFRDEDGEWADAAEVGVSMLEAFVDEYGKDERYRVIASERTFRVSMGRGFVYVGTCDGVWVDRQTGRTLIKEWKTTKDFWTKHLALDEQAGSYWAFMPIWLRKEGILPANANIDGILYTFLRKAKPDSRMKNELGQALNQDGTVSKRQPLPLFERHVIFRDKFDRQMIRARALAEAQEMELCRTGQMTVYKNPNRFNCPSCPMLDPCILHETGADYRPLLKAAYETYDPYSAHEIKVEGKESR